MALHQDIKDERPVTLYCTITKSVLGIFLRRTVAAKYVFGLKNNMKAISRMSSALYRGAKIRNTELNTILTFRFANEQQMKTLGSLEYVMIDDRYKPFNKKMLDGFHDTRATMAESNRAALALRAEELNRRRIID